MSRPNDVSHSKFEQYKNLSDQETQRRAPQSLMQPSNKPPNRDAVKHKYWINIDPKPLFRKGKFAKKGIWLRYVRKNK